MPGLLKWSIVPAAIILAAASTTVAETVPASPPNVVMIMTDNHGAWTLGCYGNHDIRTPNIDRLAQEGTLFDNAFASNPVCSPTRASVLTGLIPSQHGVHCFLRGGRLQTGPDARCTLSEFATLPKELNKAGYSCGLVGKWHLGGNMTPQEGFDDYWITTPHGGTSTFYDAPIIEDGKLRKEPQYLTDFWTKHAVNFIKQRAEAPEKPFFLMLTYNGPYALSRLLLREGKNRHAEYYRDKALPSFPREPAHPWQLHNRDYQNNPVSIRRVATEVSGVDDGVGTVMDALKANGFDDNTVVVFLADQGWVGGHGGFFGMGDHTRPATAVDGMMKIPMIWRQPNKIASGRRSQKLVANYDIMPTLLEHMGLPSPWDNDDAAKPVSPGISFGTQLQPKAAAENAAKDVADAIFYEFETLRCIRTYNFKYTHRFPNGPHELYDLKNDPQEFDNLYGNPDHAERQTQLKGRLDAFFAKHASPKYNLYNGGGSQTVIYDGIDEEIAQQEPTPPPELPNDFVPHQFTLPDGFSAELVAGPPLVNHPTMGCFDDRGRLFVCDGAGVNMSAEELEKELPNNVTMLEDCDNDGIFDKSTVFADKMTFPMGGAWHDGALFVASPPNIWRLEDTDDDGVADKRDIIVDKFGYTGNAASIHGCFFSPSGRMYWCDGYHGHEFKDADGKTVSKRKGSYIFSCWPDGSDIRIHCGGGMDNPVEVDFTEEGDMIGTVNILYTRPRIDCLVHWQYGGAYPHREAVLDELTVTGDLLGPIHKFGHVAVSGTTRYRSGVMDHRWGDNFFVTYFNLGKVVRTELERSGSTYSVTEREFLSCNNRDFHPTDVIEDADGSLLVVDTGGWFYRGCPTSQMSKPDVFGGIYRIRRDRMTTVPDPRGKLIDWSARTEAKLMQDLKDTRFAVREKAIQECAKRGDTIVSRLSSTIKSGDILARRNAIWAATRVFKATANEKLRSPLLAALSDRDAGIRQTAWHAIGAARMLPEGVSARSPDLPNGKGWSMVFDGVRGIRFNEVDPAVRREGNATLAVLKMSDFEDGIGYQSSDRNPNAHDREEEHALDFAWLESTDVLDLEADKERRNSLTRLILDGFESLVVVDQIAQNGLPLEMWREFISKGTPELVSTAARLAKIRANEGRLSAEDFDLLTKSAAARLTEIVSKNDEWNPNLIAQLVSTFGDSSPVASAVGKALGDPALTPNHRMDLLYTIAKNSSLPFHESWEQPIVTAMRSKDIDERVAAINAAGSVGADRFVDRLIPVASDQLEPVAVRLAALTAAVRSRSKISENGVFSTLIQMVGSGGPREQQAASRLLGTASLNADQLSQIAPLLAAASPSQLIELVPLFKRSLKPDLATAFLSNLENARGLGSLPMIDVSEVVKRFPQELHDRANALLDRMRAAEQQKVLKLDSLIGELKSGDAARGREVFFSKKAKCADCHVVGTDKSGQLIGKRMGPDLTTIGANRTPKDLLESIIFPSATLVRQYEPYALLTTNGRTFSGLVIRDTAKEVTIQQSTGEPVTVARDDIEELVPGTVSIMPKGLDEALTPRQIADLVSWMQTLR